MIKDKKPNLAESACILQMRRWPTLYRNEREFFLNCVAGGQGDHKWVNGLLVCAENRAYVEGSAKNGAKPEFVPYPLRISAEVAADLMYPSCNLFFSATLASQGSGPLNHMPDNMHKDWQEFIGMQLYHCEKLPPELYATMVEAYCIVQYGMRDNPHANFDSYKRDWAAFYARIPSWKARLRAIEEMQRTGAIPPYTYQGMYI